MTKSNKTKRHMKMDGQLLQFQYHHNVYENQRSHLQLVIPFTTQLQIRFLCCLCEVTAGVSFQANAIDSTSRRKEVTLKLMDKG